MQYENRKLLRDRCTYIVHMLYGHNMTLSGFFFSFLVLRDSTYYSFCGRERAKGEQEENKRKFCICLYFLTANSLQVTKMF